MYACPWHRPTPVHPSPKDKGALGTQHEGLLHEQRGRTCSQQPLIALISSVSGQAT